MKKGKEKEEVPESEVVVEAEAEAVEEVKEVPVLERVKGSELKFKAKLGKKDATFIIPTKHPGRMLKLSWAIQQDALYGASAIVGACYVGNADFKKLKIVDALEYGEAVLDEFMMKKVSVAQIIKIGGELHFEMVKCFPKDDTDVDAFLG